MCVCVCAIVMENPLSAKLVFIFNADLYRVPSPVQVFRQFLDVQIVAENKLTLKDKIHVRGSY